MKHYYFIQIKLPGNVWAMVTEYDSERRKAFSTPEKAQSHIDNYLQSFECRVIKSAYQIGYLGY